MFPAFAYVRPDTLPEAVDRLARGDAHLLAGGTDLLGCLRDGVYPVDALVSLSALQGLDGIAAREDGGLAIGAMATLSRVAEHPDIAHRYAALAQAAGEVGSPQLRNQGTLGGNLCQKPRCWYYRGDFHCLRKGGSHCYALAGENPYHCILGGNGCYIVHPSDTAAALVAFDAQVTIVGPRGTRHIPVADLHMPPAKDPTRETVLEPGEVVVQVTLPPPAQGLRSRYRKVRARRAWDFAVAGCALALAMDGDTVRDCRVVLSAAAPIPWRARQAEGALRGQVLDDPTIRRAARAAVADATPMSGNAYKLPLFRGLLEEELSWFAMS
jgi:xanthine dehydrogenase YagS FAD-binding subunit